MSKIINFANQDLPESSNGLEDYIGEPQQIFWKAAIFMHKIWEHPLWQ